MTDTLALDVSFTVRTWIDRAPAEVFDALIDPQALCAYFTATASAPLVEGSEVRWSWRDGEAEAVEVVEVFDEDDAARLVLRWKAAGIDDRTTVTLTLDLAGHGGTAVRVHETGWRTDPAHLASSYEHCAGWQRMLACLKAWLEHGIDLRD